MSNFIDMTGWKMSEHGVPDSQWFIIKYEGQSKWLCQCSCGNQKIIDGKTLRNGSSKSCGCRRFAPNFIDETGKRFGRLTVVSKDGKTKDNHALWLCQCDCGNTISVASNQLRSGHTSSCGCLQKEIAGSWNEKQLQGLKFGRLLVIEPAYKQNGNQFWKCKCDCGNFTYVSTHRLTQKNTLSCGCLISKGEMKIQQLLQQMKIQYQTQFSFSDLCNEKPLRFDFAIFVNNQLHCLIEYQGIQHYDIENNWYRPGIDDKKREYCKEHNIQLVEIPYTDYSKLTIKYIKEKCNL